ncbi:MAG: ROK family protein [Actinomycetota bacterium]
MVARSGATQEEVRRHNLAALLGYVHLRGPTTRAALTVAMGLNRSTIGALTAELVGAGLVREEPPPRRAGAGRPSLVVVPEGERVYVLAVDLGVEHLVVARVGLGGRVLDRRELAYRRGAQDVGDVAATIARLAEELRAGACPGATCLGVGASVPGVVRRRDGLVRFAPNLGWVDVPFGAALAARLDLPVAVRNDADLGALAEHSRGAAVGYDDVVYLAGEVGVGGGIIVGGRPLRGLGGYAGEVGHLLVNPAGRPCRCGGRGCWETEVGEDALLLPAGRSPGAGLDVAREVLAAAGAGDQRAAAAVASVAHWLGTGIGVIVNLFNPAVVVLGGLLAGVFAVAEATVRAAVSHTALHAPGDQVRLVLPALGPDSSLLGAAELAFGPLLGDPTAALRPLLPPGASTPSPPAGGLGAAAST